MADNIRFYDPRLAPFSIHGLHNMGPDCSYHRLPADLAERINPGVAFLYRHTAGGRVRFSTDSDILVLRAKVKHCGLAADHSLLLEAGFDLYIDEDYGSRNLGCFKFDFAHLEDYEIPMPLPAGKKQLTLNLPLYGEVIELSLGLREGATLEAHRPYRHSVPVVFYGSSITQGACAPRPGQCYQNIICRRFDCEYTNLGFSGSARAEEELVRYMATLPMCAFVSDYDHNAPDADYLAQTHHKMYQIIRAAYPDIPYFMLTKPDFFFGEGDTDRRAVVMQSYLDARRAGDKNVYFIDGSSFFAFDDREECTVDNCHPNARGFARMAEVIGNVMARVMNW